MGVLDGLMTSGGAFLKWENVGTTYTGIVIGVEARQAHKFDSPDLAFWDDGSPQMQCLLTLATDYRDASREDDDGTRLLAINLWSGQKKALIAACKAAGVPEPQPGQVFTATHVSGVGNAKAPRVFEYTLTAGPSPVAGLLEVAPEPAAALVAAPAAAPAATPVDTAKQLLAAGLSTADVAAASGLPETVVAALANL